MSKAAKIGTNYTGTQMSPQDTKAQLEAAEKILPNVPGDASQLLQERVVRTQEADRIGSVPPPGSVKGMAKTAMDKLMGAAPELLIDKLGERLAYERTGVRLYEAAIAKAEALQGSDTELMETLRKVRNEEAEHMMMLKGAIETLGADPTAQTPCADVVGVQALGIVQVLSDPRTNIPQMLQALLTIELTDNAAWELLIELADTAGHSKMAESFQHCLTQENDHLVRIKSLLRGELLTDIH